MSDQVNPAIVALLCDIDFSKGSFQEGLFRDSGQPLTKEEMELVGRATEADLEAMMRHVQSVTEYHNDKQADVGRLLELTEPYLATLPKGTPLAVALPMMTEEERAEYEAILDRVAPDGWLV